MTVVDGPVGSRLQLYWRNWRSINAEEWVISVLRDGYFLPFDGDLPPLTVSPPVMSYGLHHPRFQALVDQVQALLEKGAIEPVRDESPGFYSRLFLAPKKNGEWRPVIDLSALNKFLTAPKFKMETVKSILMALQQDQWCTSIDLKDAFLHVPMAPKHRRYLRFMVNGQRYQFKSLPFGLASSPYVFTRVVKAVGAYARCQGLSLVQYLDDWNTASKSSVASAKWTRWLINLVVELGLIPNFVKSDLEPSQLFTFVGILIDLVQATAKPAPHRIEAFLTVVLRFLKEKAPQAERWLQLLGHMTSLEKLIPRARLFMRPVQFALRKSWSQSEDLQSLPVPLTPLVRETLQWWCSRENLTKGVPLHQPEPDFRLFTDASTNGWGAHVNSLKAEGVWSRQQGSLHINNLELLAVRLALEQFQQALQGSTVLVMTDNTTVVGQLRNQGGTHSHELYLITRSLLLWADSLQISLQARHIPGHLNVIADQLSRRHQIIQTEWCMSDMVLDALWKLWGRPHVDLFATAENAKLPVYVSPLPDPQAWREDALSFSWANLWVYAFPPIPLLGEILHRVALHPCEMVLIAPAWPTQSWFPRLLELCVDNARQLPCFKKLLKMTGSNLFHEEPTRLNLHAWRLSSNPSSHKVSQRMWLGASPHLTGTAPLPSTIADGASFVTGARNEGVIRSLPLSQY